MLSRLVLYTPLVFSLCSAVQLEYARSDDANWQIGFAKVDVTPDEPLRLSGYAVRTHSHERVADSLSARAMVITPSKTAGQRESVVLVSIDSIMVSSVMTVEISDWLKTQHQIPRSQLVVSSTHTHAAPHVHGGLNNLYDSPSTDLQSMATQRYTRRMIQTMKTAITQALSNRTAGRISTGESEATFAVNRRVIKGGKWTGFGETPDGPVDHRVRVMIARDPSGELLGGVFLYACHCTTLGGDFNEISGDWAGLAAERLETIHDDATFLPIIGCGADANPNPRGEYQFAQQHSAAMVDSVENVLRQRGLPLLNEFPVARFGYAGLAPEQPTAGRLEELSKSERANDRRWASHMKKVKEEMGRLPETYPMPIHTWQFGKQLTCVFLGGEVVVDYQFMLEKELATENTWVAAYTDDVFAYVASEAMRPEGGYEVDYSMIYYLQPGRWQTGTQSLIARRVVEILNNQQTESEPLSATDALQDIRVPDEFRVELVASEPLIQDPINLAFGPDGRVWVVEMSDYPKGVEGGGRIKWLRDTNQDGTLDESNAFLDGLSYPTSVTPWEDGVIVIAAPNIFFAADRNGDGTADFRETWLTGIGEANPQHRASGFEIGLDGWLHFSAGEGTATLTSAKNGQRYEVHNKDIAWNPKTGEIRTTSGETQFVRARDAYGNWFGNSNSYPIFHFVIEDRYLTEDLVSGGVKSHLLTPAIAPPVFPRSKTVDRFNDLFALNRFTSACSSIISRVPGIASDNDQSTESTTGFVCEPVHNLVARIAINDAGGTFSAVRHPDDETYEFFTSSDPWSRPVRVVNAPDGTIWIVDMVRKVIEHPEWIPTAWQERIDLRGGENLGRIYRVFRNDYEPKSVWAIGEHADDVMAALADENGTARDLALQRILESDQQTIEHDIRKLAQEHSNEQVRISALGCLAARNWLRQSDLIDAINAPHSHVVRFGLELCERFEELEPALQAAFSSVPDRRLGSKVDLQWVLTSTKLPPIDASTGLKTITQRSSTDRWVVKALSLIQDPHQSLKVATGLIRSLESNELVLPALYADTESCVTQLWRRSPANQRTEYAMSRFTTMQSNQERGFTPADLMFLTMIARSKQSSGIDAKLKQRVVDRARSRLADSTAPQQERVALTSLFGSGFIPVETEIQDARSLLLETDLPQLKQAIIEALRRTGSDQVPQMLVDCWGQLSSPQRSSACATLLSRRGWAEVLVASLEEGAIGRNELDTATVQRLRSYSDRNLRSRSMAVFGKPSPRAEVVARYLAEVSSPFVTENSKKLFTDQCASCHLAKDGKAAVGPPLENLKHWTIDQWITAILDPNHTVEPKYRQTAILTADGQVFSGIIQERTPTRLRVAQTDGTMRELATDEIETIKETSISLMPEGLEDKLNPTQLAELLGYLRNQ